MSDQPLTEFADLFVGPIGFPLDAVFSGRDRTVLGFGLPGGVFLG